MKVPWNEYDPNAPPVAGALVKPGVYLGEIIRAEEKAGGFSLRFVDPDTHATLCFDLLTFGEKARGIALAKLAALGFEGQRDIEVGDFTGRRAWLAIKHEKYEGTDRAKVNIYEPQPFRCGYLSEEEGAKKYRRAAPVKVETKIDPADQVPF